MNSNTLNYLAPKINPTNTPKTQWGPGRLDAMEIQDFVKNAGQVLDMAAEISDYFEQDARRYSGGFKDEGGVIARWR